MNLKYFYIFLTVLFLEIGIVFSRGFLRHSVGDFLVVILLYSLIRTFSKLSIYKTAFLVLGFSFLIEFLQLLEISKYYPQESKSILNLLLGSTFSLKDLVAYTLGILCILFTENKLKKKQLFWNLTKIEKGLIALSFLSILLFVIRVIILQSLFLSFLIWNLILAVVPYLMSKEIIALHHKKTTKRLLILWIIPWMLFLPNAPYIITDFIHLQNEKSVFLWLDTMIILGFASTGLVLAILSINNIYSIVKSNWSKSIADRHLFVTVFLCGYGIYLGRFLRFNSWSILTSPLRLSKKILYSFNDLDTWIITLGFGSLLWILSRLMRSYSKSST